MLTFFQNKHFKHFSKVRNTIRVSNGLDPDQECCSVSPDLRPTVCKDNLQTASKEIVKTICLMSNICGFAYHYGGVVVAPNAYLITLILSVSVFLRFNMSVVWFRDNLSENVTNDWTVSTCFLKLVRSPVKLVWFMISCNTSDPTCARSLFACVSWLVTTPIRMVLLVIYSPTSSPNLLSVAENIYTYR